MNNWLKRVIRDERGIETLEWILIGAIIVGIATIVYGPGGSGALSGALTDAVTAISAKIQESAGSGN